MKQILTLFLAFCLHSSWASTYYFSTSSGNDARSASQAKSPSTPWKSINKLNSFFSSLQPGDQVLFKRGETFYGSIKVSRSGSSSSPIVFGAYGSGDKPIITSLVTLSGWTASSTYKGVYQCDANSALGSEVNIVVLNNEQKSMGRYPNSSAANKGYLTFESHSGRSSITDKGLTSSPNWTGAELVLRTSHWIIDRNKITSHSGSTIYYSRADNAKEPRNGYGYFIQNSIKTLDQVGEWYYNPSTKKLSMYFGSNSPSSYSVKASTINNLVNASDKSYLEFNNLTFKGANQNGIDIYLGSKISVKNCDILFSGKTAVSVKYNSNFLIEGCNVANANNNGIAIGGSTFFGTVRNNTVTNTFTMAGMGESGEGQGYGIRITKGLVEYNKVTNSGFVGIQMWGNNTILRNNYVDNFCFVKDDGAGIYSSNGTNETFTGRKIVGNIVLNGIGAREGTDANFSSADGIYMDDDVNGVEISGNTVANSNRGLYLHNTRNIIVRNNTIYNNINGQLHMKHDNMGGALRKHTITKNIFFSKYSNDVVSAILTKDGNSDIAAIGRIDSNYYARPIASTNLILTTTYVYTSSQKRIYRDLPEWKSTYNKDEVSKLSGKTITDNPDYNIKFVYNATRQDKTFSLSGSYVDAKNNKFYNSIVLKPYSSAVLIKAGTSGRSADTANKAPDVSITTGDNLSYTASAPINITATASDADGTVSSVKFYNGSTLINSDSVAPYTFDWTNVPAGDYTITAKAIDNKGAGTTSPAINVTVVAQPDIPSVNNKPSLTKSNIDFKLFPNPAVNHIRLNFSRFVNNQRATLTIQNLSGSVLRTIPVVVSGQSLEVDISSLNTGMFIMTLSGDRARSSRKFLKIN